MGKGTVFRAFQGHPDYTWTEVPKSFHFGMSCREWVRLAASDAQVGEVGMMKPSPRSAVAAIGRGFLGAIVGMFLGPFAGLAFFDVILRVVLHIERGPKHGPITQEMTYTYLAVTASVGALLGSIFGVTVGAREIRGPVMTRVAGLLIGAALGALVVAPLGKLGLDIMPFSAAFGGLLGATVQ